MIRERWWRFDDGDGDGDGKQKQTGSQKAKKETEAEMQLHCTSHEADDGMAARQERKHKWGTKLRG
jgi:hypothetical protein